MEELIEKIKAQTDVRANLIEIKKRLQESGLAELAVRELRKEQKLFLSLLKNDDAKVRKNAALILGKLGVNEVADPLFHAYEQEPQMFVKSDYLKALEQLDFTDYIEQLKIRLKYLADQTIDESAVKHVQEEMRQLQKMILSKQEVKKHKFNGYEVPVKVLLTTNKNYRGKLAGLLPQGTAQPVGAGVKVQTDDIRDLMKVRIWKEMLFPLRIKEKVDADPKKIAEMICASNILTLLDKLHEGAGSYYFRLEIAGRMTLEEKSALAKKTAFLIEKGTGRRLINTTTDYEIEIRLLRDKEEKFLPLLKLYTIPDKRFTYRKQTLPTSMHPVSAALMIELAKPYLMEDAQVLDPCCGVGTLMIERAKAVPTGDMYGIDIYGDAIQAARENTQKAAININYINRDFFDFTHAYLFDEILTELPQHAGKTKEECDAFYQRFFDKAATLLTPGGKMILYSNEIGFVKKQLRLHKEYQQLQEFVIREKEGCYVFVIEKK